MEFQEPRKPERKFAIKLSLRDFYVKNKIHDSIFSESSTRGCVNPSPVSFNSSVYSYSFKRNQRKMEANMYISNSMTNSYSNVLTVCDNEIDNELKCTKRLNKALKLNSFHRNPSSYRCHSSTNVKDIGSKKTLKHIASDSEIGLLDLNGQTPRSNQTPRFLQNQRRQNNRTKSAKLSIDEMDNLTKNNTTNENLNGLRRFSSAKPAQHRHNEDVSISLYYVYDKEKLILDWLLGLECEEVEEPPEPEIEYADDVKRSTQDTALHIVYNGH